MLLRELGRRDDPLFSPHLSNRFADGLDRSSKSKKEGVRPKRNGHASRRRRSPDGFPNVVRYESAAISRQVIGIIANLRVFLFIFLYNELSVGRENRQSRHSRNLDL